MHSDSVNRWLRNETPKHMQLLSKLRERLELSLEPQVSEDADGRRSVVAADVGPSGTPTRDWCRAFARYQAGYATLISEEREKTKLQLLAKANGGSGMTDEEYESELGQLIAEGLRQLSVEELAKEFLRRGMGLPVHTD